MTYPTYRKHLWNIITTQPYDEALQNLHWCLRKRMDTKCRKTTHRAIAWLEANGSPDPIRTDLRKVN
jgi:hypothetical protein